jgi:hypothetical protein
MLFCRLCRGEGRIIVAETATVGNSVELSAAAPATWHVARASVPDVFSRVRSDLLWAMTGLYVWVRVVLGDFVGVTIPVM